MGALGLYPELHIRLSRTKPCISEQGRATGTTLNTPSASLASSTYPLNMSGLCRDTPQKYTRGLPRILATRSRRSLLNNPGFRLNSEAFLSWLCLADLQYVDGLG